MLMESDDLRFKENQNEKLIKEINAEFSTFNTFSIPNELFIFFKRPETLSEKPIILDLLFPLKNESDFKEMMETLNQIKNCEFFFDNFYGKLYIVPNSLLTDLRKILEQAKNLSKKNSISEAEFFLDQYFSFKKLFAYRLIQNEITSFFDGYYANDFISNIYYSANASFNKRFAEFKSFFDSFLKCGNISCLENIISQNEPIFDAINNLKNKSINLYSFTIMLSDFQEKLNFLEGPALEEKKFLADFFIFSINPLIEDINNGNFNSIYLKYSEINLLKNILFADESNFKGAIESLKNLAESQLKSEYAKNIILEGLKKCNTVSGYFKLFSSTVDSIIYESHLNSFKYISSVKEKSSQKN